MTVQEIKNLISKPTMRIVMHQLPIFNVGGDVFQYDVYDEKNNLLMYMIGRHGYPLAPIPVEIPWGIYMSDKTRIEMDKLSYHDVFDMVGIKYGVQQKSISQGVVR